MGQERGSGVGGACRSTAYRGNRMQRVEDERDRREDGFPRACEAVEYVGWCCCYWWR